MKKYKLISILIIVLVIFFVLMNIGCGKTTSGSLKIKQIDSQTVDVYYSYSNTGITSLIGVDSGILLKPGSDSGVQRYSDLSPNTSYTFQLCNGDTFLDTITYKTKDK
jgi:hypothetical protein